jgi:PhnB protein
MTKKTSPIPTGCHTVTPYLTVLNAKEAIAFYQKAFGAEKISIMSAEGRTMHAEIQIGNSKVFLCDEFPQMGILAPQNRGGCTSHLLLYLEDVDSAFDKAVKAGCTVKTPLADQFWGDRYGQVVDPSGHIWSLASHVEDVSEEEMKKRMKEVAKQMATSGCAN